MDLVEDVIVSQLAPRSIPGSALECFRELFISLGAVTLEEWHRFIAARDSHGIGKVDKMVDWCHFIQSDMYKLVCVLYTRERSIEEEGFSTGLATSLMSTLSRPSAHVFRARWLSPEYGAGMAGLEMTENTFWTMFDMIVVLLFFYFKPANAFKALLQVCETAVGMSHCWEDLHKLVVFFYRDEKVARLSPAEKVRKLVAALKNNGVVVRAAVPREMAEELKVNNSTGVIAEGGEDEEEEQEGGYVAVPLHLLLDREDDVTDIRIAVTVNGEAKEELRMSSMRDVMWSVLITEGQEIQSKAVAEKKMKKKKEQAVRQLCKNPETAADYRHAFNTMRGVLKGSPRGTATCPSQEMLLNNEGWLSARDIRGFVERAARMQPRPYTLEHTPLWVEEMIGCHDLVGRFEMQSREDGLYVRATHGHKGCAEALYEQILKNEDNRWNPGEDEDLTVWFYEKKTVTSLVKNVRKCRGLLTYSQPGIRLLLRATVAECQEYKDNFEPFEQMDADFTFSENRNTSSGCFVEIRARSLLSRFDVFCSPTGKAMYAFSKTGTVPPFIVPTACMTGTVWGLWEQIPLENEELTELVNTSGDDCPTFTKKTTRVREQPVVRDTASWEEEEREIRGRVEEFVRDEARSMELRVIKKSQFQWRKRITDLKEWIRGQNLQYQHKSEDEAVAVLLLSKPEVLTNEDCEKVMAFLQLPSEFDVALIKRACTASNNNLENYEELEFVGDALLGCVVAVDKLDLLARTSEKTSDERSVVSFMCSNRILTHLLPPCLSHCYETRGSKVKADVVEALIGAVYDGGAGLDGVRSALKILFAQIPDMLASIPLSEDTRELLDDLQRAWAMCPYRTEHSDFSYIQFGIQRVVEPPGVPVSLL